MIILPLSNPHSQHRRLTRLPDADSDILVHSGDFTMNGDYTNFNLPNLIEI